jgi:hypothetical protein
MAPEQLSVVGTEANHFLREEGDDLRLTVNHDQQRRGMRVFEGQVLLRHSAVALAEGNRAAGAESRQARQQPN